MRRLVYVSGPISAPTVSEMLENIQRFAVAENYLMRQGYAPINPAADAGAVALGGITYEACMERDVTLLRAVAAMDGANWQLPGWQTSTGAMVEYHICRDLRVPCVEAEEGIARLHDVLRDDFVGALPDRPDD